MTRRERMERRLERRLEWADSRERKSAECYAVGAPYRGDVAFNTQPGHIPARARVIRSIDKSFEHSKMAAHHEAKADGIQHQLDHSIFSDDADAPERLRERIAELEATRDARKRANVAFKRGGIEAMRAAVGDKMAAEGAETMTLCPYHGKPFPAYSISNIGANIRRLKLRLESVERERRSQP